MQLVLLFFILTLTNCTEKQVLSSRAFEFTYSVSVLNIPKNSKRIDLWLPVPQSNKFQEISDVAVDTEYPYSFHTDSEYGNRMLYLKTGQNTPGHLDVTIRFRATRKAYSAWEDAQLPQANTDELQGFLQPDSLVPINGKIADEAFQVVTENMNTLHKVRALYDHLTKTVKYDKSGTGWGRGDALFVCEYRRGNCTDFHSLFMGTARALGIPTRFIIGFPLPADIDEGTISGYHCWAEFYLPDRGWVPVDISEAAKHPEKREFLFGGLDADRIDFTIGRDIELQPQVDNTRLNYFIYPYVLVDGQEYHNIEKTFFFRTIKEE